MGRLYARRHPQVSAWGIIAVMMVGSLTPDLVDKPLMWLGVTPYGRTAGHAALTWGVLSALALAWPRQRQLRPWLIAWVIGGWSHLVADLCDDAVGAWLYTRVFVSAWMGWPWWTPDQGQVRWGRPWWPCLRCWTPLEFLTILGALWVSARARRARALGPSRAAEVSDD